MTERYYAIFQRHGSTEVVETDSYYDALIAIDNMISIAMRYYPNFDWKSRAKIIKGQEIKKVNNENN